MAAPPAKAVATSDSSTSASPLHVSSNDVSQGSRTVVASHGFLNVSPYPMHLVSDWQLPDGTNIVIRPIRSEDADLEKSFVHGLSDEAKYFRFMETIQELTPAMLVRFTQIDYDQEMALMAVTEIAGEEVELGIVRYAINPDGQSCEFALVVADQW